MMNGVPAKGLIVTLFSCVFVLAMCCAEKSGPQSKPAENPANVKAVTPAKVPPVALPDVPGIANPASVYCGEKGGRLEIMDGEDGQYGVCIFKDGSRCEEWRFFRKECFQGTCRKETGICQN